MGIKELFDELGKRFLESDYSIKKIGSDNKEIKIEEEERDKGVKLSNDPEKIKKKKKFC